MENANVDGIITDCNAKKVSQYDFPWESVNVLTTKVSERKVWKAMAPFELDGRTVDHNSWEMT